MKAHLGFSKALLFAAFFLSVSAFGLVEAAEEGALKIGDPPPKIILSDLNGHTMTIPGDFKGKVVIIHFWAVWCSRCLEELSALQSIYINHKQKGLVVIAINQGQSKEEVRSFVKKLGITYPVSLDPDKKLGKQYGVSVLPRTFILQRNGLMKYKIVGETDQDQLRKLIMKVL